MLKSFSKDLLIYGLSSSLGKFVALFLVPIYTRIFSPEDYGTMDLISTVVAISSLFGMMQLESGVSRYYYAEKEDSNRNRMISTALWTILFLSFLILLVISVFSNVLSSLLFGSNEYSNILIIACLIIPVSNLNSLFTVIIRFKKKAHHYIAFQLLQIAFTIGITIFFSVYLKVGILGVFFGQLSGYLVSTLIMAIYLRSQLAFSWSSYELKKMAHFSLPLMPAVAGGWANSYMSRFVMVGYLTVTEIGLYAVALKIASVFQLIGSALRMTWGPFLWETFEKDPNHREVFVKIQKEFSAVVLIIVIIITLFSKEIILVFTREAYLPAAQMVGLISLSLAINNVIVQFTSIGPGITKKTKYNTLIFFFSLPINIGALFILVPFFGVIGVPISLLLGNLAFLIVGWYNSERLYYVGFKKLHMVISIAVSLGVIVLSLMFTLPLFVKFLLTIFIFVFLVNRYRPLVKQLLNKKLTNVKRF